MRLFSKFDVKILKKKFSKNKVNYPKTAEVTLFDENSDIIEKLIFGYADSEYIINYIKEHQELQLDYCYIKNLNIPKIKELFETQRLILQNFSAQNSFLDSSDANLDFSNTLFEGDNINFKNTVFYCDILNFQNADFYTHETDFEYTIFNCKQIIFSKSSFSDGDVSFKHSIFSKSIKEFENVEFQHGKVIFENTDFGGGEVTFSGTNFNTGKNSFKVANFGTGKVDFSRARFGKDETSFEKADFGDGDITFRSACFENGKVNFISTTFGDGKKFFIDADFGNGNVYFKNSNFGKGKISFRLAVFGEGIVDFHFTEFGEGDILFDSAVFKDGGIDFKAVDFGSGKVSFKRTSLGNGDIIFENCTLNGIFSMKDSVFGTGEFNLQEAQFQNADVEILNVDFGIGKISFKNSIFKTLSLKGSQLDNYFDLRIRGCEMLDLSDTVIKDIIDINPVDFDTKIERINLSGMRLLGRLYLDWRRSNIKELIYNQNSSNKAKEEQFRVLKENYSVTGEYSFEDEAYVEFKRTEAKAILEENLKRAKDSFDSQIIKRIEKNKSQEEEFKRNTFRHFIKYFFAYLKLHIRRNFSHIKHFLGWLIFDKMGKFATDPMRVLVTMLITYAGFTLLYIILAYFGNVHIISSLFDSGDPRVLDPVGKAFYHSAITFLTIGYGDYYPDGISRWISAVEGFVGLFQMSYFTVAFVRKVLR